MKLSLAELDELEDAIMRDLPDQITNILHRANRAGELEQLLDLLDMKNLLHPTSNFTSYKEGKIVVIGSSKVKKNVLLAVAESFGLDKNRFEFCLEYEDAQKYEYSKLQYDAKYRVVLFGPIPHSSIGKGDSGSVISEMENNDGYPKIVRLENDGSLKISKTNFKKALERLIEENYI